MTARDKANKARCIAALQKHWPGAIRGEMQRVDQLPGAAGSLLYGFLDAAFGKLKPSQADAGRANAVRWLRRRAQAAKRPAKAKAKQARPHARKGR